MSRWKLFATGIVVAVLLMGTSAFAAEYTTTETQAILYSNETTVLYADADVNSAIVLDAENFPDEVPVAVTGVTSNGFFQVSMGGSFYILGSGLEQPANTASQEAQNIYHTLISFQTSFPEGMPWTNNDYYAWNGGIYRGGYGCAAFAFILSDAAFGDAPAYIHYDYNNIKVGDILRVNGDTHSVIVLEVREQEVVVAEGNFSYSVHWGRVIPKAGLPGTGNYIMSRYAGSVA